MVDVSDYFNNDMVHLLRGVGSEKYFKRFGFLSAEQLKFIIMSDVTKEVFANPDKYVFPGDVFALIGEEISKRSVSVGGKGLGILHKIVGKRQDVKDFKPVNGDGKSDLKDL